MKETRPWKQRTLLQQDSKKLRQKFEKPLDRKQILCYNKDVPREKTSEPQVTCGATVGSSNRRNCFGTRKSGTHEELRSDVLNFKTLLENPLTFSTKCGRINMKRRTTLHKRERVTTMKKATLSTIYDALKSIDFDPEVLAEIEKDLTKGDAEKAKNAELYEQAKAIVLGALSDAPVTIGELYEEVKDALPEGFSKGKMQYAITRLWVDEVTKTEGKVNTYSRKG